jgi:DNA-directed RNA polymerase specialized sigma24 family protein
VDERQRQAIRRGYLAGLTEPEMAAAAGTDEATVSAYLAWWCDRGCPPGDA